MVTLQNPEAPIHEQRCEQCLPDAVPRWGSNRAWKWPCYPIKLFSAQQRKWFSVGCRPVGEILRHSFTAIYLRPLQQRKSWSRKEKCICHIGLICEHTCHPQELQKILGDSVGERGCATENDTKIPLVKANEIFVIRLYWMVRESTKY